MILNVFFIILIGLSVGSFLNVIIDRIPKGESIFLKRSHCDFCLHKLSWYDLLPVLSFFLLGAKCRYCHKKISWQYPLVEATTGMVFYFTPDYLNLISQIFYLIIFSGLIIIFVTDVKYRIIPDYVIILITLLSFILILIQNPNLLINHFLSATAAFIFFLILVVVTKGKGMGLGDVKYVFFMGLFLGYPKIIVSLYLSFLTGALISLILIVLGKKKLKSVIAFGPFMVFATMISFYYGDYLMMVIKKIMRI